MADCSLLPEPWGDFFQHWTFSHVYIVDAVPGVSCIRCSIYLAVLNFLKYVKDMVDNAYRFYKIR